MRIQSTTVRVGVPDSRGEHEGGLPPVAVRSMAAPPPQRQPQQPDQAPHDTFYRGAADTARTLAKVGFAVEGGCMTGFLVNTATVALTGNETAGLVAGLALGGLSAVGGWQLGANLSDWAAQKGRHFDSAHPDRGEAVGRNLINAGGALFWLSSPSVAIEQVGLSAFGGGVSCLAEAMERRQKP